jgi:hypothetical protein
MGRALSLFIVAVFPTLALCDIAGTQIPAKGHLERRQYTRYCPSVPETTPLEQLCAASCGDGYTQCTDYYTCFNPGLGQVCCPDGREYLDLNPSQPSSVANMDPDYCDAGEYCAKDSTGAQMCCKNGEECPDLATSLSSAPGGYLTVSPTQTSEDSSLPPATSLTATNTVGTTSTRPSTNMSASSNRYDPALFVEDNADGSSTRPPVAVQTTNSGAQLYASGAIVGAILSLLFLFQAFVC